MAVKLDVSDQAALLRVAIKQR